jgi:hypothetical protein
MNLFIFNSKLLKNSLVRSLGITLFLLSGYHILVVARVVVPNEGMHQWQNNFIRVQRYAYQGSSNSSLVLAGSSLTKTLEASKIGFNVTNLGMSGGSTQTGLEVVHRTFSKPTILLVEINETIIIKADKQIVNSIYNPVLYYTRLHIPMLRQEYQPVGTFFATVSYIKERLKEVIGRTAKPTDSKLVGNIDPNLTEQLISQAIEDYKTPLSNEEKKLLTHEAEYIKSQISQIRKDGVRVILFDIPREQRVEATVREKQLKALMRKLFPTNSFEWLPEPPPRHWTTYDGFHLIGSDAEDYAAFIGNQLHLKSLTVD